MNIFRKIAHFYIDGFQNMRVGKELWVLIMIKLFIIFVILKLFFFPNILYTKFSNDNDRANYVIENITK
ncbi:MAG: DUF4492 domain-containing protein [Sulfurospirillaceae bacterium]|nr:DUF4492 domain-containing protein [Sulfurospirillaceae bacterium]